jgi:MFS family permease
MSKQFNETKNIKANLDIETASENSYSRSEKELNFFTKMVNKGDHMDDIDSGYAWVVVTGCFIVNFVALGYLFAYGVFLSHYVNREFKGKLDTFTGSYIGTLQSCLQCLVGIISGVFTDKIGYRGTLALGGFLICLGQLLTSFSTEVWHLFVTQALIVGLGVSLAFFPAISAPSFWFKEKKGLAVGISVAGSGIGGLIWSPLIEELLDTVGFQWCHRICSLISAVLMIIAIALIRVKTKSCTEKKKHIDLALIKDLKFINLFVIGLITSFGYFVPFYLIPQFGQYINLTSVQNSILVGLISGGSALGRVVLGSLADTIGRVNTLFIGTFIAGFICLTCWIFANNFAVLVVFVIVYGFSSGAYISTFPALASDLFKDYNVASINGFLYASRALPYLIGSPIAYAILDASSTPGDLNFTPVIIYTGVIPLISAVLILGQKLLISKNLLSLI